MIKQLNLFLRYNKLFFFLTETDPFKKKIKLYNSDKQITLIHRKLK